MTTKKATSASAWKTAKPETVELPSGNVAQLQRPKLTTMLKHGLIPNPLLEAALGSVNGEAPSDPREALALVDFMVSAAFVSPQVVIEAEAPEGALSVDTLSEADKAYVVNWAQGGVREAAESFREGSAGADGGSDGGELRDEAE